MGNCPIRTNLLILYVRMWSIHQVVFNQYFRAIEKPWIGQIRSTTVTLSLTFCRFNSVLQGSIKSGLIQVLVSPDCQSRLYNTVVAHFPIIIISFNSWWQYPEGTSDWWAWLFLTTWGSLVKDRILVWCDIRSTCFAKEGCWTWDVYKKQ